MTTGGKRKPRYGFGDIVMPQPATAGRSCQPDSATRPLASCAGLRRTCTVVQPSRGRSRRQICSRITMGGWARGVPAATCVNGVRTEARASAATTAKSGRFSSGRSAPLFTSDVEVHPLHPARDDQLRCRSGKPEFSLGSVLVIDSAGCGVLQSSRQRQKPGRSWQSCVNVCARPREDCRIR